MRFDWRHRDWFWVLACFILLGCSQYINNFEFMSFISYTSTFISIALAFVAIFISVREATKADSVKDEINIILGELKEKIGQVDSKISSIDINAINSRITQGLDNAFLTIKEEIGKIQFGDAKYQELEQVLNDKFNQVFSELKSNLIVRKQEPPHFDPDYIYAAAKLIQEPVTIEKVRAKLFEITGTLYDRNAIANVLSKRKINFRS